MSDNLPTGPGAVDHVMGRPGAQVRGQVLGLLVGPVMGQLMDQVRRRTGSSRVTSPRSASYRFHGARA